MARKLNPDESFDRRFRYTDDKGIERSKLVNKKTYHARMGEMSVVHRVTEGEKIPWCITGRSHKHKPIVLHRTTDEVSCKRCIKDARYF